MDAVDFLKEAKRYCKWCKNTTQDGKRRLCEVCYFEKLNEIFNLPPMAYRKFVEAVEEWRKGHPVETRQSEFLKMYPNAIIMDNGAVYIKPCHVDNNILNRCNQTDTKYCMKCAHDYWLKEVE